MLDLFDNFKIFITGERKCCNIKEVFSDVYDVQDSLTLYIHLGSNFICFVLFFDNLVLDVFFAKILSYNEVEGLILEELLNVIT